MRKAIGSRVNLNSDDNLISMDYNNCIGDLFELEDVKKLDEFSQHLNTSRLQHSINVSYYSYLFSKKFGLDCKSAARAGLLHDLFLYDWRTEKQPEGRHTVAHPQVALRNAQKNTDINEIEADAILKHMWPLTLRVPRYKESMMVTLADKYCATLEFSERIYHAVSHKTVAVKTFIANVI